MTAYGRVSRITPQDQWVLELHSINRKRLDININLHNQRLIYDLELRKCLEEKLGRDRLPVVHGSLGWIIAQGSVDDNSFLAVQGCVSTYKGLRIFG